jgi:hypothetical protein
VNRQQTLNAVNNRRAYGPPENNFLRIARRWNVHILNRYGVHLDLQPVDVALMMADMKMARLEETPDHPDSWVDLCGYAACGSEISSGAATVYEPSENPDRSVWKGAEERWWANRATAKNVDEAQAQAERFLRENLIFPVGVSATPSNAGIDEPPVHPAVKAPEFPSE